MVDRPVEAPPPIHLLVVSEVYHPELVSTGLFATRIAESFALNCNVEAITTFPSYDARATRVPRKERVAGVDIIRCRGTRFGRRIVALRALNVASVTLTMGLAVFRRTRRGTVVLATTNPPTIPLVCAVAARLRRGRVIVLAQDLYPDAAVVAGVIDADALPHRVFGAVYNWIWQHVDGVAAVGHDMALLIAERRGSRDGVVAIPNWAESGLHPDRAAGATLRRQLAVGDALVVMFAGNHGRLQDLDTIVDSIEQCRDDDRLRFVFIGDGVRRSWLVDQVARRRLTKVALLPPRPRSDQMVFLNAADVILAPHAPGMRGVGVPGRVYNAWAVGVPVVALSEVGAEARGLIERHGAGWVVEPGDSEGLTAVLQDLAADRSKCATAGRNAVRLAAEECSADRALDAYHRLVADIARL